MNKSIDEILGQKANVHAGVSKIGTGPGAKRVKQKTKDWGLYTEKEVYDLLWKFNESCENDPEIEFAILYSQEDFDRWWEDNKKK